MRISFRQGLVKAPANFLQLNGGKVDLFAQPVEPLLAAFADGNSDYLLTERLPVTGAWQGPFVAGPQNYYLYFDIDVITGARTFNHTLFEPIESAIAPMNPADDQHWFDLGTKTMKVWTSTTSRWVKRIRVFAAQLKNGSVFISMSINSPVFTGTQIGVLNVSVAAGALVYDADGRVIKRANGTFFTTEDVAVTGVASSSHVKLGAIILDCEAQESMAAFSVVRFVDFNKIALANSNLIVNGVYGICEVQAIAGDVVSVTVEGVIRNPAWDWTAAGINAPLYVDQFGELTPISPVNPIIVAMVIASDTILMRPAALPADPSSGGPGIPLGTANQLLGVDSFATSPEYKTLQGTTNQVTVDFTTGHITLGLDIIDGGSL